MYAFGYGKAGQIGVPMNQIIKQEFIQSEPFPVLITESGGSSSSSGDEADGGQRKRGSDAGDDGGHHHSRHSGSDDGDGGGGKSSSKVGQTITDKGHAVIQRIA